MPKSPKRLKVEKSQDEKISIIGRVATVRAEMEAASGAERAIMDALTLAGSRTWTFQRAEELIATRQLSMKYPNGEIPVEQALVKLNRRRLPGLLLTGMVHYKADAQGNVYLSAYPVKSEKKLRSSAA